MKNNLTTTEKTEVVLRKGKSLLGITAKILSGSNALAKTSSQELDTQGSKDVTIMGSLMWQNEPYTQEEEDAYNDYSCHGKVLDWESAMTYSKNLRLGGYDDWRLPTIDELKVLVKECGGINLTWGDDDWRTISNKNIANESYQINYEKKGFVSYGCWSSTTYADDIDVAWCISFNSGSQGGYRKRGSNYVRCVRDRQ